MSVDKGELRFDAKVVVITGGGRNIWRQHAVLVGLKGALVVGNDNRCEVDEVRSMPGNTPGRCLQRVTRAVRLMRKAGYGRLAYATSSSEILEIQFQSYYDAAKMGLVGLMNCEADECDAPHFGANAYGPVASRWMAQKVDQRTLDRMAAPHRRRRHGDFRLDNLDMVMDETGYTVPSEVMDKLAQAKRMAEAIGR